MKAIKTFFGIDTPVILGCLLALIMMPFLLKAGPARAQSTGTIYGAQQVQRVQQVNPGVIIAVRDVLVEAQVQDRAMGATAGGLLSGAILNRMTRNASPADRTAATLLAASVGAYGGNAVAARVATSRAQELIVETTDQFGRRNHFAVVQPEPGPFLAVGQPVFVLSEGGRNRVIPNNTQPNAFGYGNQYQQTPSATY